MKNFIAISVLILHTISLSAQSTNTEENSTPSNKAIVLTSANRSLFNVPPRPGPSPNISSTKSVIRLKKEAVVLPEWDQDITWLKALDNALIQKHIKLVNWRETLECREIDTDFDATNPRLTPRLFPWQLRTDD